MSRINELKPNVFNMIAAGEVVERPSSVVKELIENSLDAGATIVDVEIENGGLKTIKVSDNGIGMDKTDLVLSVKPHATSKLSSAEDLSTISTFGFRGEALASIEAVSKVKIVSKIKGESAYCYDPGVSPLPFEAARMDGTTVEICDLFYNVPARLKFLKSTKTEEKYIFEKVANLILANPEISFSLKADGRTLIQSNGKGAKEALYSVFGNLADKFYEMNFRHNNFILSGFISDPEHTRSTRSGQVIIVNGRVVQDKNLCLAVERAYGGLLMKHSYPMFVLSLILPFDFVDVNVHPQKSEVRFQSPNAVFGFVYKSVAETLAINETSFSLEAEINRKIIDKGTEANLRVPINSDLNFSDLFAKNQLNEGVSAYSIPSDAKSEFSGGEYKLRDFSSDRPSGKNLDDTNENSKKPCDVELLAERVGVADESSHDYNYRKTNFQSSLKTEEYASNEQSVDNYGKSNLELINSLQNINTDNGKAKEGEDCGIFCEAESTKVLCSLFDTYLLVKNKGKIYLIDQHAAHERIIFDRLISSISQEESVSQPMLFSFSEEIDYNAFSRVKNMLPSLQKIGFEIALDESRNRIEILAIPAIMLNVRLKEFLHNLLTSFNEDITIENLLYERICQSACKAAIKGGDSFTEEQLEYLIKDFKNDFPKQCPHGRPAIIEIEKQALEKLFKRIV